MAATDQTYRNQKTLDIVFAISCLLMLASIVWMFVEDYNREFKTEQREFRKVEQAIAQRTALQKLPGIAEFKAAKKAVDDARKQREKNQARIDELDKKTRALFPEKERSEQRYQGIKAELDSRNSFYDLAVDEHGPEHELAKRYKQEVLGLKVQLEEALAKTDSIIDQIQQLQRQKDKLEQPLNQATAKLKKLNEGFDLLVRTAHQKQWGASDWFRSLPILDAFNSPTKIQQFTLNELPIDYNFKYVSRFDRCMSCHRGIDRDVFSRESLEALLEAPKGLDRKVREARIMVEQRQAALADTADAKSLPDPDDIQISKLSADYLTPARITEFAAHPRIDIFAGANSKHPAEKFGCSICHRGQGSATSFTLAAHTPNNPEDARLWIKTHDWSHSHDWEFPMLPSRFIESSCLMCHHQVTDLISSNGNQNQAPKLLRGFNLIKDNGCFGCHEIQGFKDGRSIGPDLRTEPSPPLDKMSAAERARVTADPNDPPGSLRKVGPSLYRVAEKTNPEWVVKWLRAPREFRPDTKMPHFYGLSNNNPHELSDEFRGKDHASQLPKEQKDLPDTEMHAITHYLFVQSRAYLDDIKKHHGDSAEVRAKDKARLELLQGQARLSDDEKKEMGKLLALVNLQEAHGPIHDLALSKDYKEDKTRGRLLFSERGCLACHSHDAVLKEGDGLPAIPVEAQFGPNLSQITAKLGTKPDDKASARRWVMYWIKDPQIHSPRSRMPVTHLTNDEIADVAAWLLDQAPQDLGDGWAKLEVQEPNLEKLDQLASVSLRRYLTQSEWRELEKKRSLPADRITGLPEEEQKVAANFTEENIKLYIGKKAIARLGCFGCHDIPGFENAKPIGVALLDWGKKDANRLAFEDIDAFINDNFRVVESLTQAKSKAEAGKDTRPPYEAFFADALRNRSREGYLHQKVLDPRSYDYHRLRLWDDRSRMPQFRFARSHKKLGESKEAFRIRAAREEAEAREAVMTFVLGLVAEPIPLPYVNHPAPDRMAEVKGRQILDTYNCAGCHLIQPGTFAFKVSDKTTKALESTFKIGKTSLEMDFNFLYDHNWAGQPPTSPDRLTAFGAAPRYDDEDKVFLVKLTQALRFKGSGGEMHDIRASSTLSLPPSEMIEPPPEVAADPAKIKAFEKAHGPFGGTFADLLVRFLTKRAPQEYKRDSADENADSADGRTAAPPSLIGQGERTQPEWLFKFLLDPQRVRKMTVLRMPKFNMSPDEARGLVNYFAGATRVTNPGVGLVYPYAPIPQQVDLTDPYWRRKTAEYVARLKAGDGAAFKKRVDELQPRWEAILKETQSHLNDAKEKLKTATARAEDAKKKNEEAAVKEAEKARSAWEGEVKRLEEAVAANAVDKQKAAWEQQEAYVTDAFKLVANRDLCLGCHQLGGLQASEPKKQGPPLTISFERLRPGWTQRWVANTQRFLTYPSVMPQNFPANKQDYQHLFVGTPLEQVSAVRDILMIYPRAAELPLNRQWVLPAGTGDKK
jgi:mono/diheme cytochrome c family protein